MTRHYRKGIIMRKGKKELRISCSYEPNRLAATYLSDAYEILLPTVRHSLKSKSLMCYEDERVMEELRGNWKW